jgi:chromosome partitioning protein
MNRYAGIQAGRQDEKPLRNFLNWMPQAPIKGFDMSARRIAFVNCKGGVGKTTLTVNVGAALVKHLKRKVLIVDLDAQSNASIWLMGLEHWQPLEGMLDQTICAFFKNGMLEQAIRKSVLRDESGIQLLPNLDLIPAVYDLLDLDFFESSQKAFDFYQMFWFQIQAMIEKYDYILFDCPPSLGRATQCGIYASKEIYVPCTPDLLSGVGLRLLHQKLCEFADRSKELREVAKKTGQRMAKIRGVILNYYSSQVNTLSAVHAIEERIKNLSKKTLVDAAARVLPPRVRTAVAADRAAERALPVILSAPTSPLAEDFEKLARWIDQNP